MSGIREQLALFADQLAGESERRRQFVATKRREVQQLRAQFAREQQHTAQQIEREAADLARSLSAYKSQLRRSVAFKLGDLRATRAHRTSDQRTGRRSEVLRIRRGVVSELQRFASHRKQASQSQLLSTRQSLHSLRRRVADVRSRSQRFTASFAADLAAGRRALAAARGRVHSTYALASPDASIGATQLKPNGAAQVDTPTGPLTPVTAESAFSATVTSG